MNRKASWITLVILFLINTINFFDRLVIGAVGESIRKEFVLDDKSLGLLSTAFILLYALAGIPLGRLADRFSRKKVLSAAVFTWSCFTLASGLAVSYWQIFAARLGVGIGESGCAPAANSLIADIFPPEKRGRATSIFMLGLPIGIALSFAISGTITKEYGWRFAFLVAGIPGIFLSVAALFITEPVRENLGNKNSDTRRELARILSSPAMRWLIVSGAIHNFCLYALSFFLTPFLIRYHGLDVQKASFVAMFINGVLTIPGLLFGGFVGDWAKQRRPNGSMILLVCATMLAAPLFYFGLNADRGNVLALTLLLGLAFTLMYFYYSIVYSTIQDIADPQSVGFAMSVYFFVMYVLGGALGTFAIGGLSDYFTHRAAVAAGVFDTASAATEPFRAAGLQNAMQIVPALCVTLALVLFAASRTVAKEIKS